MLKYKKVFSFMNSIPEAVNDLDIRNYFWQIFVSPSKLIRCSTAVHRFFTVNTKYSYFFVPLIFRKAGRVWCSGAREAHWPRVTMERLLAKPRSFPNLPAFLDLNGKYFSFSTFPRSENLLIGRFLRLNELWLLRWVDYFS